MLGSFHGRTQQFSLIARFSKENFHCVHESKHIVQWHIMLLRRLVILLLDVSGYRRALYQLQHRFLQVLWQHRLVLGGLALAGDNSSQAGSPLVYPCGRRPPIGLAVSLARCIAVRGVAARPGLADGDGDFKWR